MKIKRTDGRPIYDDDGILDVSDNASALATGFYGGRLCKLPESDIRSLTVEIGI